MLAIMRTISFMVLVTVFTSCSATKVSNNNLTNETAQYESHLTGYVTPQMFGAKGDGVTNDTKAFQRCIASSDNIYIPEGNYIVTIQNRKDPSIKNGLIINRSNVNLKFANGAVIRGVVDATIPRTRDGYDFQYNDYNGCLIWIRGDKNKFIENVVIEGGTFIGVRSDFNMSTQRNVDESGNGIRIHYTKNCIVKNCVIKDNQGDNILAYYNKNLTIEGVKSYDCRRTGISVGPCEGFLIKNCMFYNNGCDKMYNGKINYATSPMNAICLEGDVPDDAVLKKFNNIVIKDCYCESGKLSEGSEQYVFVGRNTPGFVEIGQLAHGGNDIRIENNKVFQEGNSSGAIHIHVADSYVKRISVVNNEFAFIQGEGKLSSTSNHVLVLNGNLDNLIVKGNKYTNNVRFVYLYQSKSNASIKNVTVENNVSDNVNGSQDKQLVESFHGNVDSLIIKNNQHNGRCVELLGASKSIKIEGNTIIGNYSGVSGGALFYCIAGTDCKVDIENNNIKAYYKNNTGQPWYILRGSIEYLDGRKRLIQKDGANEQHSFIKTGNFLLVNNTIDCEGEYLSMFPANTFNGKVTGNYIKATGYRLYSGALKPYKQLAVSDNTCESLPVQIIDDRISKVKAKNNHYTN